MDYTKKCPQLGVEMEGSFISALQHLFVVMLVVLQHWSALKYTRIKELQV